MIRPAAMANLLGDEWRDGEPNWADALEADGGLHLHLYGKQDAVIGRKMGHLTALDPIADRAADRVMAARERLCPREKPT